MLPGLGPYLGLVREYYTRFETDNTQDGSRLTSYDISPRSC